MNEGAPTNPQQAAKPAMPEAGELPSPLSNSYRACSHTSHTTSHPTHHWALYTATRHATSLHLNHLDHEAIVAHGHALAWYERELLEVVEAKIEAYPRRFGTKYHLDDPYLPKAILIALSDWKYQREFCHCCWPQDGRRSHTCGKSKLCTYCNYLRRREAQRTYLPAFEGHSWAFVNLSFIGDLCWEPGASDVPLYWDACAAAIRHLVAEVIGVHGAYWVEEVSIKSFYPQLRVLPHCHALLHVDSFDEAMAHELAAKVAGFRDEGGFGPSLAPSVRWNVIARRTDFFRQIGYISKTIKLVEPYMAGVEAVRQQGAPIWRLNNNVRQFFYAFDCDTYLRQQILRRGTLDPRRRAFIGIKRAHRQGQRRCVEDAIMEVREEGLAVDLLNVHRRDELEEGIEPAP